MQKVERRGKKHVWTNLSPGQPMNVKLKEEKLQVWKGIQTNPIPRDRHIREWCKREDLSAKRLLKDMLKEGFILKIEYIQKGGTCVRHLTPAPEIWLKD